MFPGGQDGAAHAAAQMPLSMPPEGEAMFNTNSVSSKSPDQHAGFPPMSKKVLQASPHMHSTVHHCFVMTSPSQAHCVLQKSIPTQVHPKQFKVFHKVLLRLHPIRGPCEISVLIMDAHVALLPRVLYLLCDADRVHTMCEECGCVQCICQDGPKWTILFSCPLLCWCRGRALLAGPCWAWLSMGMHPRSTPCHNLTMMMTTPGQMKTKVSWSYRKTIVCPKSWQLTQPVDCFLVKQPPLPANRRVDATDCMRLCQVFDV